MDKQWEVMTTDEKTDWLKNKIADLVKAVERLNDPVDETRKGVRDLKRSR
jgi:hypothetical protein